MTHLTYPDILLTLIGQRRCNLIGLVSSKTWFPHWTARKQTAKYCWLVIFPIFKTLCAEDSVARCGCFLFSLKPLNSGINLISLLPFCKASPPQQKTFMTSLEASCDIPKIWIWRRTIPRISDDSPPFVDVIHYPSPLYFATILPCLKECWQTPTPKWSTFEFGDLLTRLEKCGKIQT